MARKAEPINGSAEKDLVKVAAEDKAKEEICNLTRMLAAVLNYLSDDEIEEIDIEYLFEHTEGLREWWDKYRESNKKEIEEEIRQSLGELSLEELESIREQIKKHKHEIGD